MPITNIYLDESGFTGADLLNKDQPNFCVASTTISNDAALDILKQSFPRYGGKEYKFGAIWRRGRNRQGLVEFATLIRPIAEQLFVYWIDKKFCVLTKLVDSLVEPPAHAAGYDFYAKGFAPRYCNEWYYGLEFFAEPELYDATVQIYQAFARDPSPASLRRLQSWLHVAAGSVPAQLKPYYEAAAFGADNFLKFHDLEIHRTSSEVQFTTVLQCISYWRLKLKDDFVIFHDQSSNFFRGEEMWNRITSFNVPEQVLAAADGSMNEFPLRVVSTHAVNSDQCPAIQFCDIVAGLSAKLRLMPKEDENFLGEVLGAGFDQVMFNGIRPEPEFTEGNPAKLNGKPDVVDLLTTIMFGPR